MENKTLTSVEETVSLFNCLAEIICNEAGNSRGSERYAMYRDWYDRLDDIKLEMAGVLSYKYVNPAWDGKRTGLSRRR